MYSSTPTAWCKDVTTFAQVVTQVRTYLNSPTEEMRVELPFVELANALRQALAGKPIPALEPLAEYAPRSSLIFRQTTEAISILERLTECNPSSGVRRTLYSRLQDVLGSTTLASQSMDAP